MNSGLYALAGASATATAAAWAKRLLEPITNVSNVYLGLSLAAMGRASGWPVPPGLAAFGGASDPLLPTGLVPAAWLSWRGAPPVGGRPAGWAAPGSGCRVPSGGSPASPRDGRTSVAGSTVTAS